LRGLVDRIADGTISGKIAKDVFDAMWAGEGDPDTVIEKRGLRQISDSGEIEKIVDQVLAGTHRRLPITAAARRRHSIHWSGR